MKVSDNMVEIPITKDNLGTPSLFFCMCRNHFLYLTVSKEISIIYHRCENKIKIRLLSYLTYRGEREIMIKNIIKETIYIVKDIKEYFKTLSPTGKIIFILILVVLKLGPDLITMPILVKYIKSKTKKDVLNENNEEKEKEEN